MPPKLDDYPKALRPFVAHGLDPQVQPGTDQAVATCPWCGKAKFYVNVESGLWDCKVCDGKGGNDLTFVRKLHDEAGVPPVETGVLAAERGVPATEILEWGVKFSPGSGGFIFPGHDTMGRLTQLYKWGRDPRTKKSMMYATAGLKQALLGVLLYDPAKPDLYLCEGHWDGPALRFALGMAKRTDAGLAPTGNREVSLLEEANVLAVPGANVWEDAWAGLFAGKRVYLCYDSDHPRATCTTCQPAVTWRTTDTAACPKCGGPGTGRTTRAGWDGMRRVAEALGRAEEKPASVSVINWGADGFDPLLKDGYDVRDALKGDPRERLAGLEMLLSRAAPIPGDWIKGRSSAARAAGGVKLAPEECRDWATLRRAWVKTMKWIPGLDRAMICGLASIASTTLVGDQLWFRVVGPPACGKSSLCEAWSVAEEFVVAKSTVRGFHSGYVDSDGPGKDHSLVSKLYNKTLVTKDGDTLMKGENRDVVLSEARDIYDRVSRTSYRHGVNRDYNGLSMTWILCGTSSLRELDTSELGERFLTTVIMDGIDEDLEDELLWRAANQADDEVNKEATQTDANSQYSDDRVRAMRLTGGYIEYLRRNAPVLIRGVTLTDEAKRLCTRFGLYVAHLRARPSKTQEEVSEREVATRLTKQFVRLCKCVAVVLNKTEVDGPVLAVARAVALDTAAGRTHKIAAHLQKWGEAGQEVAPLQIVTGEAEEKIRPLMRFMRKIGTVEQFVPEVGGYKGNPRWRLTARFAQVWNEVYCDA